MRSSVLTRCRKRHDARTRHDRTELRNKAWAAQLDGLVTAYLTWQANNSPPVPVEDEGDPFDIMTVNFFGMFVRCSASWEHVLMFSRHQEPYVSTSHARHQCQRCHGVGGLHWHSPELTDSRTLVAGPRGIQAVPQSVSAAEHTSSCSGIMSPS